MHMGLKIYGCHNIDILPFIIGNKVNIRIKEH